MLMVHWSAAQFAVDCKTKVNAPYDPAIPRTIDGCIRWADSEKERKRRRVPWVL